MPQFVVVLRTRSGAVMPEGERLEVNYQAEEAPVNLRFMTRRKDRGFGFPMVLDLTIEVCGQSASLDEAQKLFGGVCQGASAVLALAANAIVEQPPIVELAYDVTPELEEHDFFQRRYQEPSFQMLQGRRISPSLLAPLFERFGSHPEVDRLGQATVHYNIALTHWRESALLAVNHLWIGIETLTPAFLRRECNVRNLDEEGLYKDWDLPPENPRGARMNKLNAEVRSRLIFEGDRDCYRDARRASDGFEHGYLRLNEALGLAAKVRDPLACHLRRAIFDLAELDQQVRNTLLQPPFDRPLERGNYDFQLRGKLVGAADSLTLNSGEHPHFDWDDGDISATPLEDGVVHFRFGKQSLTARLGDDVTFKLQDARVYGPRSEVEREE